MWGELLLQVVGGTRVCLIQLRGKLAVRTHPTMSGGAYRTDVSLVRPVQPE